MHIKRRGRMACLYRSRWVPKGAVGNTHGYSVQSYVGGLRDDSCSVPAELAAKLSDSERSLVERRICIPVREAAACARQDAENRKADPLWRLGEAKRLIDEVVERSQRRRVPRGCLQSIAEALEKVSVLDADGARQQPPKCDPLLDALSVVRAAASAVRDGAVGSAPSTGARTTRTYFLWSQIVEAVDGAGSESLLTALQLQGFVKKRRR